ncbi:MAG: hypothetical protein M1421_03235 [Candidatus Eremiobacteraeota bacterium]|nr:hypothetical protein [Candidatus Eremiobacteraeota bacterium]
MTYSTSKTTEQGRKVPVLGSSIEYPVSVKVSEELDLPEEEKWLLGPFHSLQITYPTGECISPELYDWVLGPERCPFHEWFS